jgi:hypothetical protein
MYFSFAFSQPHFLFIHINMLSDVEEALKLINVHGELEVLAFCSSTVSVQYDKDVCSFDQIKMYKNN